MRLVLLGLAFFFLVTGASSGVQGWLGSLKDGKIELVSPYSLVYVGENITLYCVRTTSSFSGDVEFKFDEARVPDKYVKVLNDTYARLDRPAFSEDAADFIVNCYDNSTLIFGASQTIQTEYRPQKVSKLNIEYYDKSVAKFRWDLGLSSGAYKFGPTWNQNNPITTVRASYSADNGATWIECPSVNQSVPEAHTSCQIEPFNLSLEFQLRVIVNNTRRMDEAVTVFPIDNINNYYKPRPVQSLSVQPVNSTAVNVSFYLNKAGLDGLVKYQHQNPKAEYKEQEISANGGSVSTVITELHPAYTYTFEVYARPHSNLYLSDPVNATVKMPEDAPASGPIVLDGGYRRSVCSKGKQDIFVYFQPVVEADQNGEIVSYHAVFESVAGIVPDERHPSQGLYLRASDVPCGVEVNVSLYAHTKVGQSPPSSMSIPSEDRVGDLPREVARLDLLIEKTEFQIVAHWDPPPHTFDYQLYLCYCREVSSYTSECKDPLQFVKLNADNGSYLLDTGDQGIGNGKFGLSIVASSERMSGILFTECTYTVTGKPDPAPATPWVLEGEEYVQVSWQAVRCDGKRVVHGYMLRVCPANVALADCDNEIYIDGGDTANYRVSNLKAEVRYHIQIAANTTSSRELTAFSQPVFATLKSPPGLDRGQIAGIVIGVLFFVVIVIACVICSVRSWYKKGKAKFDTEPIMKKPKPDLETKPPELPDRNPNQNNNGFASSEGTLNNGVSKEDSGVFTNSSRSSPPGSPLGQDKDDDKEEGFTSDYSRITQNSGGPNEAHGLGETLTVMHAAGGQTGTRDESAAPADSSHMPTSQIQRLGLQSTGVPATGLVELEEIGPYSWATVNDTGLGNHEEGRPPPRYQFSNTGSQDGVESYVQTTFNPTEQDVDFCVRSTVAPSEQNLDSYVRATTGPSGENHDPDDHQTMASSGPNLGPYVQAALDTAFQNPSFRENNQVGGQGQGSIDGHRSRSRASPTSEEQRVDNHLGAPDEVEAYVRYGQDQTENLQNRSADGIGPYVQYGVENSSLSSQNTTDSVGRAVAVNDRYPPFSATSSVPDDDSQAASSSEEEDNQTSTVNTRYLPSPEISPGNDSSQAFNGRYRPLSDEPSFTNSGMPAQPEINAEEDEGDEDEKGEDESLSDEDSEQMSAAEFCSMSVRAESAAEAADSAITLKDSQSLETSHSEFAQLTMQPASTDQPAAPQISQPSPPQVEEGQPAKASQLQPASQKHHSGYTSLETAQRMLYSSFFDTAQNVSPSQTPLEMLSAAGGMTSVEDIDVSEIRYDTSEIQNLERIPHFQRFDSGFHSLTCSEDGGSGFSPESEPRSPLSRSHDHEITSRSDFVSTRL